MNIKGLLTGLLSVSATIVPMAAPAMAGYTIDTDHGPITLMDGSEFGTYSDSAREMIYGLTEAGVPVIDGGVMDMPVCEIDPESQSYTMGYYVPADNYMVICTDNIQNEKELMEVLTHETVHVIQDMRTGLHNDTLDGGDVQYTKSILNNIDEDHIETIYNFYDEDDYVVELEAFYFQDKHEVVNQELAKFVF